MSGSTLKDFLNGYIIVRAECLNPEKFINLSSRYGIKMWDIQRMNFTTIEFKMKYFQYRKLKSIIRKTNSKTKIIHKFGANFMFHKMSRRKFFVAGIVIFLGIIFYLSSSIWKLEITGNRKVDTKTIYDSVRKAGLKEGRFKQDIDLRDIESGVLRDLKEISLINIKFIGTKAKIEIVERTMPPEIVPADKPANITAFKEGIILNVLSYKGQPLVKIGDYVRKDQVLISGIITDSSNVPLKIVHAMGKVVAKTWYEAVEEVSLNYVYESRTGKVKQKTYIMVLGKKVYIKNDEIDFKKYDKIEEKTLVNIRGKEMPVERVTEYYFEKVDLRKQITTEEAFKIAADKCEENIKIIIPKDIKILDKKVSKEVSNGKVKVKLLYIGEESIGIETDIQ